MTGKAFSIELPSIIWYRMWGGMITSRHEMDATRRCLAVVAMALLLGRGVWGQSPAVVSITSTQVANGLVGSSFTFSVTASGGAPTSFSLVNGTLPPGLTLDTATGLISGTPTQTGLFMSTI